MAERYTRRINLYINDKEVRNDIASISKEMYKLQNQQRRLTIGSQEYNEAGKKIRALKGIIQQHNTQLKNTEKSWFSLNKAANAFNKYFGMITATLASFTGVALTIKSATQAYAEFDDRLADVMKTTGLTKDQVKELNGELKKIDTRTAQTDLLNLARVAGKLGITGQEEILGFVRAADQIVVALGEDMGGAEDAVRELGKLTDIFKIKDLYGQEQALLKVGSAINELGMASTANEGYLVEFSKRTAGIAPQAGVSIQNILGLAATLDALGQKAEMSSTAYGKLMTTMTKKTSEFARIAGMSMEDFNTLLRDDANEAMIRVFEGISKTDGGFQQMVAVLGDLGVEGQRMTSVFGALANNTDMLREQQRLSNEAFEQGISLTNEFNIKNNTAQATLDKARKRFAEIQRELGEKLTPAYAGVIKKGSTMIKMLGTTVEFLFKHSRQLAALIITITAYTVATRLATLWQNRHNSATLLSIATQKLQALAFKAQFAAIALYNSAIALLTGRLKVATIQFRAFAAAIHANPIGIVVGAIVAAGAALYMYSKRLTATEKAQKTLNDINLEAKKRIVEEKMEVERLVKVARDDFRSKEDRIKAINQLNKISPEYLGKLSLETINTESATDATEKYIKSLEKKARIQAATEKLEEIEKELLDLQMGGGADPTFLQQTWNAIKSGGNMAAWATANAVTASNNLINSTKELNLQKEKLLEITSQQVNLENKSTDPPGTGGEDDPSTNTLLNPDAEKTAIEDILKELENAYKKRQLIIQQQYSNHELTDAQYKAKLWIAELAFLEQKKALMQEFGQETIDLELQLIEKRMDQLRQATSELLASRKEIQDLFDKEMADSSTKDQDDLTKSVDQAIAAGKKAVDEMNKNKDEEASIMQKRGQIYMDLSQSIGDSFQELLITQEMSFGQFLKNTLMMALDALEKMMILSITEATMKDIATKGLAGIAIAAAKIVLIKAAFATAKGAVMGFGKKEEKEYYEGGATPAGPKHKPVGVVHAGEYIVPQEGTKNARLKPLIDFLEFHRVAGTLATADVNSILGSMPQRSFATGGYGAGNTTESNLSKNFRQGWDPFNVGGRGIDDKQNEILEKLGKAVNDLIKWKPTVYTEMIKKQLDTLEDINKNRGL